MTRRSWLAAVIVAAGCATPGKPLEEAFPPSLPGGWRLLRPAPLPVEEAPAEVRTTALRRAARAEYAGAPACTVSLFEMKSSGNAFELLQKWRPAEGRMAFHHGRFFGIAESPGAPHPALQQFVDAFEKKFAGA